jgi:hypothetical protein
MKDINETLLEKVESPSQSCDKCFYDQWDDDIEEFCCCRPTVSSLKEPCFEFEPGGKYYIFVEKN